MSRTLSLNKRAEVIPDGRMRKQRINKTTIKQSGREITSDCMTVIYFVTVSYVSSGAENRNFANNGGILSSLMHKQG